MIIILQWTLVLMSNNFTFKYLNIPAFCNELNCGCLTRHRNSLPFSQSTCIHPLFFLVGSVLLIFLVFCVEFFLLFVFVLCLVPNVACVFGLSIFQFSLFKVRFTTVNSILVLYMYFYSSMF